MPNPTPTQPGEPSAREIAEKIAAGDWCNQHLPVTALTDAIAAALTVERTRGEDSMREKAKPPETAPYGDDVLAWLYLPKNPIASAWVIGHRVYVQEGHEDDPAVYAEHERRTVECWWANGRYYAAGHVKQWMHLPPHMALPGAEE